jgi:hypothetical protein
LAGKIQLLQQLLGEAESSPEELLRRDRVELAALFLGRTSLRCGANATSFSRHPKDFERAETRRNPIRWDACGK